GERTPTLWTGAEESQWLGWLDEPRRMAEQAPELVAFAEVAVDEFSDVVLLGIGGASLAPEVLRRCFLVESLHVLDTTHPRAIRSLEERLARGRTLFLVSSKSGGTIETLAHLDDFCEQDGKPPRQIAVATHPGPAPRAIGR